MNPLYGVGISLVMAIGAYVGGRYEGEQLNEAKWIKAQETGKASSEAALREAAKAIAKIDVRNVTITKPIQREVYNNPVYTDCKHTQPAFDNLNLLLSGKASAIPLSGSITK